jgi:hypothetical protein
MHVQIAPFRDFGALPCCSNDIFFVLALNTFDSPFLMATQTAPGPCNWSLAAIPFQGLGAHRTIDLLGFAHMSLPHRVLVSLCFFLEKKKKNHPGSLTVPAVNVYVFSS